MQITYQKTRENADDITVYWTLTDDQGNSYQWHGDIPKGVDVQKHIESQMENYLLLIRRREYPDNPLESFDTLETWEKWIADGCIIPAILDDNKNEIIPERVAEKVEWTNKHPVEQDLFDRAKLSGDSEAKLDALIAVVPEAQIIKDLLMKKKK